MFTFDTENKAYNVTQNGDSIFKEQAKAAEKSNERGGEVVSVAIVYFYSAIHRA